MQTASGGCHCDNIRVELTLTRSLSDYSPRACDCGLCMRHRAACISDPEGSLIARIADPANVGRYSVERSGTSWSPLVARPR